MARGVVVALSGLAASGKSTAAEYLDRHHGFVRHRFAAPLKDMMRALGLTERHIEGDLKEVPCDLLCGRTPRWAMQSVGTEWGRDLIHPDLWVSIWKARALASLEAGLNVVAEDCRFPNEADAVRALGGRVIRLKGRGGIGGSHASENLPEPDMTVWNNGPLEILHARLDGLVALPRLVAAE
jgi:hypothetical protein